MDLGGGRKGGSSLSLISPSSLVERSSLKEICGAAPLEASCRGGEVCARDRVGVDGWTGTSAVKGGRSSVEVVDEGSSGP